MTEASTPRPSPRRRRRRSRKRHASDNTPRSVPLRKRTTAQFKRGDRQRGTEYFRRNRVQLEVDGSRARSHVKGTERTSYGVGIDWSRVGSKGELSVYCQCPRFAQGQPCKHLWATLMALAETGPKNQPPGDGPVTLSRDHKTRWKELGEVPDEAPRRSHNARAPRKHRQGRKPRGRAEDKTWRGRLEALGKEVDRQSRAAVKTSGPTHNTASLAFLINTGASLAAGGLVLDIFSGTLTQAGRKRGPKLKRLAVDPDALAEHLEGNEEDDAGLTLLTTLPATPRGRGSRPRAPGVRRFLLPRKLYDEVLPRLCADGALGWWDGRGTPGDRRPIAWDAGVPWHLALRLDIATEGADARVAGVLERGQQSVPLDESVIVLPPPSAGDDDDETAGGASLVLFSDRLALLEASTERDLPWIAQLRATDAIVIPQAEIQEALTTLLTMPQLPRLELPAQLELIEEESPLRPSLVLKADSAPAWMNLPLLAELFFLYGEHKINAGDPRPIIVDWQEQTILRRDMEGEHRALVRVLELGLSPITSGDGHDLQLKPEDLPTVAEPLLLDGWAVEVHGTSLRPPNPPKLRVESGVDWFELGGQIDFAGESIDLTRVLAASARGDRFIELADGSKGLLPEAWVETYDSLSKLSHSSSDEGLRFLPTQALLVDALLGPQQLTDVDQQFAELREKLRSVSEIKPKRELRSFEGTLRGYQREGLGWLAFLREFGLGGVLADDMGLGKTVQVLALILAYRTPAKTTKLPFLVVAPRSLLYNWIDEAARFVPKLKVLEYAGADREAMHDKLGDYDLVLTTYGTLRRDIGFLAGVELDTVILDEAQAIKNRDSQSAKASRLLVARHRLALTGTPIENHLGELGSIFEFLNPGLFGRLPRLEALASGRTPSSQELKLIAEGTRPFILRRTKKEVLPDLPPKTEQTLYCELQGRQRELYDQLRLHYQTNLLQNADGKAPSGSTFQVLEALLRLRQVACHPGLVDEEWAEAGSAKLESLFQQVSEVLEEGHKAIVFSQFTKLLAYVKKELDERGIAYAYLDGQTRKRGEVVERFQTDPECNLFLISLKAGGVGLNLTAAGYVFLLDPWWNPAVEAQAIDRAHRIGQTQPVFAYGLIARDTVEDKILELQRSKRQLADAILEGEGRPLSELTADDLRMLLS